MERVDRIRLITVVLALCAGGCFAPRGGTEAKEEASSLDEARFVSAADQDPGNVQHPLYARSEQAAPGEQQTGPLPEPWQRTGPLPEPWIGHIPPPSSDDPNGQPSDNDPNGSDTSGNNKP